MEDFDMFIKIQCSEHKDCFANTNGYCTCLMNNDFGGRDCPFYKDKSKAEAEREQTRYTLTKKGRTDLIEMYHRRKVNAYSGT